MKIALVGGCGVLNGAFSAGAIAELCREFGPTYFSGVYGSSVTVFAVTFLVANQPNTIENTWRNYIHGRQLVNPANMLSQRHVFDIEYLIEIFQNEKSWLDREAIFASKVSLTYAVTEYASGKTQYIQPRVHNLFQWMKASTAMPIIRPPVEIDGQLWIDGGLSDPFPIAKALADGYDHVVAITHKLPGVSVGKFHCFMELASMLFPQRVVPKQIKDLIRTYRERVEEIDELIEKDNRVTVIRPQQRLPLHHFLDSNKRRLNGTIQMGIESVQLMLGVLRELSAKA